MYKKDRYTSILGTKFRYDLCPCDSGVKAKFCCMRSGSRWKKTPSTLDFSDPSSHLSLPKCYAHAYDDCSGRISKEHFISASVLHQLGDSGTVKISGLRNGPLEPIRIERASAKVLCTRHNRALHELDDEVLKLVKITKRQFNDLGLQTNLNPEFKLLSGTDIERWLLKALCGAVAATNLFPIADDFQNWVDILFGRTAWPDGWGMYVEALTDDHEPQWNNIRLTTLHRPDDPSRKLVGMQLQLMYLNFVLFVCDPHPDNSRLWHRPTRLTLVLGDVRKYIELSWFGTTGENEWYRDIDVQLLLPTTH